MFKIVFALFVCMIAVAFAFPSADPQFGGYGKDKLHTFREIDTNLF